MKLFFAVLFALFAFCAPVAAQWQTGVHTVPVGQGGGTIGFGAAGPGTIGIPLIGQGPNADPIFSPVGNAGMVNSSVDNTKLAPGVGPSIKCNPTVGNAAFQDCTFAQMVAAGLLPLIDAKAGVFIPLLAGSVNGVACNAASPFNCMQFCQYKGNLTIVNGQYVVIPPGGCVGATGGFMSATTNTCIENSSFVTTCSQTLANATTYFAYLGFVSGNIQIIYSTNFYQQFPPAAPGNATMSGDPSRSLIGVVRTDPSAATISGTANQQNSASYINSIYDGLQVAVSGTFSNTGAYTNLGTCSGGVFTGCLTWVQFSNNVPTLAMTCDLQQNSGATITPSVGIGLSTNGTPATVPSNITSVSLETGNLIRQTAAQFSGPIGSDGYVIANPLGLSSGGGSPVVTPSNCTLQVPSRVPS